MTHRCTVLRLLLLLRNEFGCLVCELRLLHQLLQLELLPPPRPLAKLIAHVLVPADQM